MLNNNETNKYGFSVWLQFAEEDLLSAEALLEKKIHNQVCFHSQQSVEKILKAFLKSQKILPPKIHSLLELLEMCKEKNNKFCTLQKGCAYLSRFYLSVRYPDALAGVLPEGLPSFEEAKRSLAFAEEIIAFVKKILLSQRNSSV
ncbi:MAG: HEPN domain-containing protein [Candidatus Omnitrophota bacterium]